MSLSSEKLSTIQILKKAEEEKQIDLYQCKEKRLMDKLQRILGIDSSIGVYGIDVDNGIVYWLGFTLKNYGPDFSAEVVPKSPSFLYKLFRSKKMRVYMSDRRTALEILENYYPYVDNRKTDDGR